jgi:hypothetical protein
MDSKEDGSMVSAAHQKSQSALVITTTTTQTGHGNFQLSSLVYLYVELIKVHVIKHTFVLRF